MQIIPVIDIRGGIVVLAKGGNRAAYPPLKSVLTGATVISQVVGDILSWYPFKQLYIADLDAIETAQHRPEFYADLAKRFAMTEIWLDAGITDIGDFTRYPEMKNLKLVVGSETLKSMSLLEHENLRQSMILSLDRRGDQILGEPDIVRRPELWTDRTIVMDLDVVGANQGPSIDWLTTLMRQREDIAWFAAGGVRDSADLQTLKEIQAAGALIASALHTGKLDKTVLQTMEQVHRPS